RRQPARDLTAPRRPQGRESRDRAARGHAALVPGQHRHDGRVARVPRRLLDLGARAAAGRGRGGRVGQVPQAEHQTEERQHVMAELVREIMIDATPETIWPFLTEPDKHVEWMGTVADIDPRPGGTYRVRVRGEHQSAGEYTEVVRHEKVVFTF